ncbi:MAG: 50S ribosomal protein L25 [bacterium]
MPNLKAEMRKEKGRKTEQLREKGIIPAVLYGPQTKPLSLAVDQKEFLRVLDEAGESSLISLEVTDEGKEKSYLVLIHQVNRESVSLLPIHIDFYQPNLEKEVEVTVPIILDGEAPAVKELGGTLVRNISEVEVKAKPQLLPKEIRVSVESLKTIGSHILIKDIALSSGIKILKDPGEIIALISEPEKVEEELQQPIEENVEEVERIEKKKEEKEEEEGEEVKSDE